MPRAGGGRKGALRMSLTHEENEYSLGDDLELHKEAKGEQTDLKSNEVLGNTR